MSQVEIENVEWENAENWYLGVFYFSRRDTRPFVPKRGSSEMLGATINFARPGGVLLLLGVIGFVALLWWLDRKPNGVVAGLRPMTSVVSACA